MNEKAAFPEYSKRVFIGKIVKVRGLRGDLKILPLTWRPGRFEELEEVLLTTATGEDRRYTVKRMRVEGSAVYARFNEIFRRDLAEELVNSDLFVDEDNRDKLPEGHYYIDDLVGCSVMCSRFGNVGKIAEVYEYPANEVWRVVGRYGEILVPSVGKFVDRIDLEDQKVFVTLLDGMIDEEALKEDGSK